MKAILAGLFGFGCALAVTLGGRMGGAADVSAVAVALAVCGPVVLVVLLLLHRANDAMTQRALSGVVRQNAPETATMHFQTLPDAGRRYGLDLPVRTHSSGPVIDGQWREYASSAPRIERGRVTTRHYRRNRLGPGAASVGAVEVTHTTPHREPNPGADLLVPLGQAVVSAVIAALLAGVLAAVAGRTDTLRIVGVAFVGVLAVAWLWRLGVVDSLLSVVERITQTDIDGDGLIGDDDATHGMVIQAGAARAEAGKRERSSERALRLADLLAFAQRCATVGCSERSQGIRAGTPQQEAYRAKRDLLLLLGIAKWRDAENHNAGWVLTVQPAEAAEILRHHVMDVSST